MEKSDARKITGAAPEERRKAVIRLYRSGKYKTYQEISEVTGIHRNTASIWTRNWEKDGNRTLKTKHRGRSLGECRRLLPHEEAQICKDLVDHCPDQLKLPFMFIFSSPMSEISFPIKIFPPFELIFSLLCGVLIIVHLLG